jgi:hypothetical protein
MARTGPLPAVSNTWKYALIGGLVSLPLTIWSHWSRWQSGIGDEFSLNMVFVGGLVAGYLVTRAPIETPQRSVGFRAGVIGALPGLWLDVNLIHAAINWGSPLWFRIVAVVGLGGAVSIILLAFGGLVGAIGAKIGGWLARKTGANRTPPVGN